MVDPSGGLFLFCDVIHVCPLVAATVINTDAMLLL